MRKILAILLILVGSFNLITAQTQSGIASVRKMSHQGMLTKTGELFSHDSLVASHRSIPLGSLVKITNLKNLKSIKVRINDRGPFIKDHIIDLSKEAGVKIGLGQNSLANVRLDVIELEEDFKISNFENLSASDGNYTIKQGSFGDKQNAENFAKRLTIDYKIEETIVEADDFNGKPIYRVYIGRFPSRSIAEQYLSQLPEDLQDGYVTTFKSN